MKSEKIYNRAIAIASDKEIKIDILKEKITKTRQEYDIVKISCMNILSKLI